MDFDTTELYLNLIQVHCLYRVLFTRSEIRKGQKQKKKTLDTTEVLAKSIYRYVIFLVNIYDDKQRCSVFCLKKTSFFLYIYHNMRQENSVSIHARTKVSSHCSIGNIVCNGHTQTLFHVSEQHQGGKKKVVFFPCITGCVSTKSGYSFQ